MNKVTSLFNIKHPIIQGGMVWNSGWQLVSAVSNAGGLGLLGAGSMYPDVLVEHIKKCKSATSQPFGVNIPLMYPDVEKHLKNSIDLGVKIVFTSAGNPKIWTPMLKEANVTVVHVVSSVKFALKAQDAGVDAIVAEGFEAGGHNGREETTTFCLIPNVAKHINIPMIAAGGIATGAQIHAAMVLGADGVQIGSRFAASKEASSHQNFKQEIVNTKEGDTQLTLKELAPARLIKNDFYFRVQEAYNNGATTHELRLLLGKGRAKKGMFEGNLLEGELEIGQCASMIDSILPVKDIMAQLVTDYNQSVLSKGLQKF